MAGLASAQDDSIDLEAILANGQAEFDRLESGLPLSVGGEMWVQAAETRAPHTFWYEYQYRVDFSELSTAAQSAWIENLQTVERDRSVNFFCNNATVWQNFRAGIMYVYDYVDVNDQPITQITIGIDDC